MNPNELREIGDDPYGNPADRKPTATVRRVVRESDDISEKVWQAEVMDMAIRHGWIAYHCFDSRRSEPGFPDLVLAHPAHGIIFAELKTNRGKLTDDQEFWLGFLAAAASVRKIATQVWRPGNMDSVVEILMHGIEETSND